MDNKKPSKIKVPLIILFIFMMISFVIYVSLFQLALFALSSSGGGKIIGAVFALVFFVIFIIIACSFAIAEIPISIVAIKKLDNKVFPIIVLVLSVVIIICGFALAGFAIVNSIKSAVTTLLVVR